MELDLDALERIARAVETPGPWETRCEGYKEPTRVCHDSEYVIYLGCDFAADLGAQDAEHIAAFDPPTVLGLIAELRRARECIETLESKSMRLINANDGEWVEIPAEDWDAALTTYDQEGAS